MLDLQGMKEQNIFSIHVTCKGSKKVKDETENGTHCDVFYL